MIDDLKVEITVPLRECVAFVSRQSKAKDLIDQLAASLPDERVTIVIGARPFLVGACDSLRKRGLHQHARTISQIIKHAKQGKNLAISGSLRVLGSSMRELDAFVSKLYQAAERRRG